MKIGLGRRVESWVHIFFLDSYNAVKPFIPLKPKSIFHQLFFWLKSIRVVANFMIFTCLVTMFCYIFWWMVRDMKKKPWYSRYKGMCTIIISLFICILYWIRLVALYGTSFYSTLKSLLSFLRWSSM